ncbi:MAG: hypothetical protein VW338_00900 [Rhodospirillaceae bacterium]
MRTEVVFDAKTRTTETRVLSAEEEAAYEAELAATPAPSRRINLYTIIRNIETALGTEGAAEKLALVKQLDPVGYERLQALGAAGVILPDARLSAGLQAIGLDPEIILT